MIGFLWSLYLNKYFFDRVRNKSQTISILKLIKRRSKVQEKNMS